MPTLRKLAFAHNDYDFLSNIPNELQDVIEQRSRTEILNWINSNITISSLLAAPDTAIGHNSFIENGISKHSKTKSIDGSQVSMAENGISKIGIGQISTSQIDIAEVGISKIGFNQASINQDSTSQISPFQGSFAEHNSFHVSSTKIGEHKARHLHHGKTKIGIFEDNVSEIDIEQFDLGQINPSEISFASSIPSEQFFSSHNSTPQIINELNNSATKIWSDLLQSPTQLDIDFQVTDLPKGQLAEATITGFDDSGVPNAGTILIDHNANGVGWFIDETPLDNSEFSVVGDKEDNADKEDMGEYYLLAAAESEADGKYDLLTTVLHELAHLYGFIDGYAGFDANIETKNGITKFISNDFEAILDGEHLNKEAHPHDLMNTHLAPGIRKLPSELNVEILQAILKSEVRSQKSESSLDAALTSDPLLAISNGDFSINDTTTDSFAWDTRGASGIENGQAVLTEDSPFLSNFTQTFTVPEEAKTLQFKLVETELGASELLPPDAFEVALLDTNTNQSLTSDPGLTATDSLLNIQNDGTAYFSDKVRIGGASSGEIIDLDKSRTVSVDISHLAAGTEATLYFDLLGFGDVDSRVVIDDVRLSDQFLLTPVAVDDTANTIQGQPVEIDILANDTDDDGVIATNSVQIQTEPSNGAVIPRLDGTVSYLPDQRFLMQSLMGETPKTALHRFAGTDRFTYVVQDNDGQFSEPATVEVTVDNVAPEISEIQIPDNVTEGVEFTLNAVATDAGNDRLTYMADNGLIWWATRS